MIAVCFGLFILWSTQAVLAGFPEAQFTDSSNVILIVDELVLGSAALLYLRARGFDIGSLYPRPTLTGAAKGLVLFVACAAAGALATAVMQPSQGSGMVEFAFRNSLATTIAVALVNGVYEEVFLLGVLVRGLRSYGLTVAVGLPLLVRTLYHLYQGPLGAVWVAVFGLVVTLAYIRSHDLWPPVFAHILGDIVPTL